jgi:hypothetical protein
MASLRKWVLNARFRLLQLRAHEQPAYWRALFDPSDCRNAGLSAAVAGIRRVSPLDLFA